MSKPNHPEACKIQAVITWPKRSCLSLVSRPVLACRCIASVPGYSAYSKPQEEWRQDNDQYAELCCLRAELKRVTED